MNKYQFTFGELTFYYILDEKHVDIFVSGISNTKVNGIMTTKEFDLLLQGLQRIKAHLL